MQNVIAIILIPPCNPRNHFITQKLENNHKVVLDDPSNAEINFKSVYT